MPGCAVDRQLPKTSAQSRLRRPVIHGVVAELARQARRVTDEAAISKEAAEAAEAAEAPPPDSPFLAVLRKLSTERGHDQVSLGRRLRPRQVSCRRRLRTLLSVVKATCHSTAPVAALECAAHGKLQRRNAVAACNKS